LEGEPPGEPLFLFGYGEAFHPTKKKPRFKRGSFDIQLIAASTGFL